MLVHISVNCSYVSIKWAVEFYAFIVTKQLMQP